MKRLLQFATAASFLLMVVINFLANSLPINGQKTAEISGSYPNLFEPASFTFSIWGLIYLATAFYTLYQFGLFRSSKRQAKREMLARIDVAFILANLVNCAWILTWHYDRIGTSLILILLLLILMFRITRVIMREQTSWQEYILVKLPFSLYYGWIIIATMANLTTYLASIDRLGEGQTEVLLTIGLCLVGAALVAAACLRDFNPIVSLVGIWAYSGILYRHLHPSELDGAYLPIVITLLLCILFFIGISIWTLTQRRMPTHIKTVEASEMSMKLGD